MCEVELPLCLSNLPVNDPHIFQICIYVTVPLEMPVLVKENFNRWYSLRSYYLAITLSDIPFQVRGLCLHLKVELSNLYNFTFYFCARVLEVQTCFMKICKQ